MERKCIKCSWSWFQRTALKPILCPNPKCQTPYWEKTKDQMIEEAAMIESQKNEAETK